jgi:hypothetical protein
VLRLWNQGIKMKNILYCNRVHGRISLIIGLALLIGADTYGTSIHFASGPVPAGDTFRSGPVPGGDTARLSGPVPGGCTFRSGPVPGGDTFLSGPVPGGDTV